MAKSPHKVKPAPDPQRETAVRYYDHAPAVFEKHFGCRVSRPTLYKYLTSGYPIVRRGARVEMPVFRALKRPMTTVQAMERFVTVVKHLETKAGLRAAAKVPA